MKRSHKIIFFLIGALVFGTFAFGILQLAGAYHRRAGNVPSTSNPTTSR
jgi:hypothetical protein